MSGEGGGETEGEGQKKRDKDYGNVEATAVQLWQAAVSTEGDEAWARTGASVHATMTGEVARTDTQRKQSCMQMCVWSKQVIIEYIKPALL